MKPPAYGRTSVILHWAHAGLLATLVYVGLHMVDLPKGAERSAAYAVHKSLGLLALGLVALRLAWRLYRPPPRHPGLTPSERAIAGTTHRLLYLLLLLVPATGFAAICFTPYPLAFFGLPLPKPGWPDPALNALFNSAHKASLVLLGVLTGLHLAAAALHAWRGDGTLGRMLPLRSGEHGM